MSEIIANEESNLTINQIFQNLQKNGNFDISPCDNVMNIDDNPKFKKLELTSVQKMQMSALASQLPSIMALDGLAKLSNVPQLYVMSVPNGLQNSLVQLKNGSYMNMLRGSDGKFIGTVPLYSVGDFSSQLAIQSAMLGTFSVMSLATGQYFLAQINSELDKIKLGMDKILEFLYGDKRAELISEISFVKYAYHNYSAIADSEVQRIATIAGVQQAKKVAMKDCEFYISDLCSTLNEDSDIGVMVGKACSIQESLEFALQLCVMSSVLEVYYSQNFNPEYLKYIERDVTLYIDKCENYVKLNFAKLQEKVEAFKGTPLKKVNKELLLNRVNKVLGSLNIGDESPLKQSLRSGLYSSNKNSAYYLNNDGDVYIKIS